MLIEDGQNDTYHVNDFFFCYSINLFQFLKYSMNISFICVGLHEKSMKKFWLFKRDIYLTQALDEYKKQGIRMGVIKV